MQEDTENGANWQWKLMLNLVSGTTELTAASKYLTATKVCGGKLDQDQ
jgi:hypothetical protein